MMLPSLTEIVAEQASIGPGGIEMEATVNSWIFATVASIGPGGIEMGGAWQRRGVVRLLQSDQVELK